MQYALSIDPSRVTGTVNENVFGHFIEHLGRCIYGGVYEPGSPLADEQGFRTDVLAAMRKIGVPNLRWPGGNFASNYHWEDGIGPQDKRPARFDLAWRSVEPNTFGTEEFLAYCDALSTERVPCRPYVCLNTGTGTLDEAVRWLEYCNLDSERFPTYHARWRAQLGRTEPYAVPYWGIGNEVYGSWQVGNSTAAAYADKCVQYARFLKAVDPNVKVIAVGADDPDWDLEVLKRAGGLIDYISIHEYCGKDDHYGTVAAAAHVEKRLQLLNSVCDVAEAQLQRETPVEVAFDEWNVWYRARSRPWEEMYALKDAIFAVGVFHAMYRQCKRVTMANLAQMVNALGMMHTTPETLVLSPLYHVFDFFTNHTGRTVLDTAIVAEDDEAKETISTDISVGIYGRPAPRPKIVSGVSFIDVAVTLTPASGGETRVSVSAVNRHETRTARLRLDTARCPARGAVDVQELTGDDPMRQNTVEHPNAVSPTSRRLDTLPDVLELAPASVTIFKWVTGS